MKNPALIILTSDHKIQLNNREVAYPMYHIGKVVSLRTLVCLEIELYFCRQLCYYTWVDFVLELY